MSQVKGTCLDEHVGGDMKVTDMKKWNQIPKREKELLLNNVFCSKCTVFYLKVNVKNVLEKSHD